MKPIRVITPGFDLKAEIDNYESMMYTRSWHGIGQLELRINKYKKHVEHLLKGNLVMVGPKKVFLIKHREIELDENGKATENWLIKAPQLKVITGQRITIPPSTTAYDNKQGNAETVMKHYVDRNIVNPVDTNRKISQLSLATNQNRGPAVSWQSRFKNLAEDLANISLVSGIGWDITLDIVNKKWALDVAAGRDLTVNQSSLPPVIFSPQFESIQSISYLDSDLNYKNTAYVGGQGEGINREVITIGTDIGLSRHEIFIDARDSENTQTLTDRGNQELQSFLQEQYLEGQILTRSTFKYEKDYELGDIVTVQNKGWGVTLDARITEIKETYETSGYRIEAVFGNNRPTLIKKIKQELAQISGEVRK